MGSFFVNHITSVCVQPGGKKDRYDYSEDCSSDISSIGVKLDQEDSMEGYDLSIPDVEYRDSGACSMSTTLDEEDGAVVSDPLQKNFLCSSEIQLSQSCGNRRTLSRRQAQRLNAYLASPVVIEGATSDVREIQTQLAKLIRKLLVNLSQAGLVVSNVLLYMQSASHVLVKERRSLCLDHSVLFVAPNVCDCIFILQDTLRQTLFELVSSQIGGITQLKSVTEMNCYFYSMPSNLDVNNGIDFILSSGIRDRVRLRFSSCSRHRFSFSLDSLQIRLNLPALEEHQPIVSAEALSFQEDFHTVVHHVSQKLIHPAPGCGSDGEDLLRYCSLLFAGGKCLSPDPSLLELMCASFTQKYSHAQCCKLEEYIADINRTGDARLRYSYLQLLHETLENVPTHAALPQSHSYIRQLVGDLLLKAYSRLCTAVYTQAAR